MKWYKKYLKIYGKPFNEVPQKVTDEIRSKLQKLQSDVPLVTVSVIGYNEEKHLPACLWSLSDMQCRYPVEIIGVDNDSKDLTAQVYESLGIRYYTEYQHSCGHARLCGLKQARGKFHINIDSDTIYPPHYVETMVETLERPGIVAVSSLWSYFPDENHSAIGLWFYECARDLHLWLQAFKRPELSVRGLVFAYRTEYARQVGIRTEIKRGEDGSLALALKPFGKIAFLRKRRARAITGYGTVGSSLLTSFRERVWRALKGFTGLFTKTTHYTDKDDNLV